MRAKRDTDPAPSRARRRPATLLIVDDDALLRRSFGRLFRGAGYEVLEASDGLEALQVLASAPRQPDVMLLDLDMPYVGGEATLARLADVAPRLKVIVVTAVVELVRTRRVLELGAIDVLHKPCDEERLLGTVLAALTEARGQEVLLRTNGA